MWCRASRLYKGEQMIFFESVEPTDVRQGLLGDCWLLGAISAMAEFPGFIEENVFQNGESAGKLPKSLGKDIVPKFQCTEDCKYKFKLWSPFTRKFEIIEVDDWVPCYKNWRGKYQNRCEPVFAKPSQVTNEVWVLLLEKAFAKLFGSYDALNGGQAISGCSVLTGLGGVKGGDLDGDGEDDASKACYRWRIQGDTSIK